MSSELFEARKDELMMLYKKIRLKFDKQLPSTTGEARKKVIREIERGIEEGNVLIQELEDEAKKAPAKYRMDMLSTVRKYRQDLDQMSMDLRKPNSDFGTARPTVGFSAGDDLDRIDSSHRARLLQGNESLSRTSDSIARTHRIAAETDEIGYGIIEELGTQRESLINTRERLRDTDSNLAKSRKILTQMAWRGLTNKLVLGVVILLELGVLGAVIWWKFFK